MLKNRPNQIKLRELLENELTCAKQRNPSFSLRSLARRLKIHSSALSEILNGKRLVSKTVADRILENSIASPEDKIGVYDSFQQHGAKHTIMSKQRIVIEAANHKIVSDWYHFAILSLLETKSTLKLTQNRIAKRLGISESQTKAALMRLKKIGLIAIESGSIKATGQRYSSPDETPSSTMKKVHMQNLQLAQNKLFEVPIEFRDNCAITMAVNPKMIPEAKKLARRFLSDMEDLMEVDPKTQVYKLCVQLYPLTNIEESV